MRPAHQYVYLALIGTASVAATFLGLYSDRADRATESEIRELTGQIQKAHTRFDLLARTLKDRGKQLHRMQDRLEAASAILEEDLRQHGLARNIALHSERQARNARQMQLEIGTKADSEQLTVLQREFGEAAARTDTVLAANQNFGSAARTQLAALAQLTASVRSRGGADHVPPLSYHVTFTTPDGVAAAPLEDGKPVTVHFFLAPPDARNGMPFEKSEKDEALVRGGASGFPLTITMNCPVCKGDNFQIQDLAYLNGDTSSGEAIFTILPSATMAAQGSGSGYIVFDITSGGVEFDHIPVAVTIGHPVAANFSSTQAPSFGVPKQVAGADVVFTIGKNKDGIRKISVEAYDPKTIALLKKHSPGSRNNKAVFTGGRVDLLEAQDKSRKLYENLRALILQEDALVKQVSKPGDNQRFNMKFPENEQLSEEDKQKILLTFYDWGNHIYRKIFEGSLPLRAFMKEFEEAEPANPPLRVQIKTTDLTLPWQLLHPASDLDENKFWGFRYRLSVFPSEPPYPGRLPDELSLDARTSVVFGVYDQAANKGDVGPKELGEDELALLQRKLADHTVDVARSKSDLKKWLADRRESLALVFVYLHAKSGMNLVKTQEGILQPSRDEDGPSLIFRLDPKNLITADEIFDLAHSYNSAQRPYFTERPVIFLNACETGASIGDNIPREDFAVGELFQNDLLSMGARGVIVTESRMGKWVAYFFGKYLTEDIFDGRDLSTSVWEIRKKFLTDWKNPLGLMYTYYGNPVSRVAIASPTPKGTNSAKQ